MLNIDTRKRKLEIITERKLSKLELKLLLLLSDNQVHEYKEIYKYLYNETSLKDCNSLRLLVLRIKEKYKIPIEVVRGFGLICKEIINIK